MPVVTRSRTKMDCQVPSASASTVHVDANVPLPGMQEGYTDPFGRTDALMNDVVLGLLFEYFKTKDLKTCRLVCKKWNILSIPSAHSTFQVNVGGAETTNSWELGLHHKPSGLDDFVEVLRSNELGIPFAKFSLSSFDTRTGVGRQFLELCGDTIKELILFRMFEGGTFMVEDVSNLFKSAPRLESIYLPHYFNSRNGKAVRLFPGERPNLSFLKKISGGGNSLERRKFCPTFFEELLMAAENVSTFVLTDDDVKSGIKTDSLEVLEILEKLNRESSVQKLCFRYARMEHLELLKKMVRKPIRLNLKTLDFGKPDPSKHQQSEFDWFEMIHLVNDTLTSLVVGYICTDLGRFPQMPKLKHLKINIGNNTSMSFENFQNNFCALEMLNVHCKVGVHDFNEFLSGVGSKPCPKMKSLILHRGIEMKTESFNRTITIFPNLKDLQLEVKTVEILMKIFTHVTQVETLCLWGCLATTRNLDSLFTGIPVRRIKKVGEFSKFGLSLAKMTLEARREKIVELTNQLRTSPSIANLTNLRYMRLHVMANAKGGGRGLSQGLTDVTGILGLYSMDKLKQLFINQCGFSMGCCTTLAADMRLEDWNFIGTNGREIIGRDIFQCDNLTSEDID